MRTTPIKKYDKLHQIALKELANAERYGLNTERLHLILQSTDALRMGLVKPENGEVTSLADIFNPKIKWVWK